MFSGFSFLSPAFLSLFVALPFLVVAYRQKQAGKKIIVSSSYLLSKLKKQKTPKSKIKLPLRFFFELLALALLALAASGFQVGSAGKNAVVLIDNSLSMSALNESGTSRLKEGKEKLISSLSGFQSLHVKLFVTTPSLTQISEGGAFVDSLYGVDTAAGEDNLAAAMREISQKESYGEFIVVTDKDVLVSDSRIKVLRVGSISPNYFFSDVSLKQNPDDKAFILSSDISFKGTATEKVSLLLFAQTTEKKEIELLKKEIEIRPQGVNRQSFTIPESSKLEALKIVLEGGKGNAILADDSVSMPMKGVSKQKTLVIVPDKTVSASSLGLSSIPTVEFETTLLDEYEKLQEASIGNYLSFIFYKTSPAVLPKRPSLFVLPPKESLFFKTRFFQDDTKISSWADDHALTQYANLLLLSPGKSQIFDEESWSSSIISSEKGPIVLAGENNGTRLAAVGFELFPFEGMKTPTTSILTLNTLSWITRENISQNNSPLFLEESDTTQIPSFRFQVDSEKPASQKTPSGFVTQLLVYLSLFFLLIEFLLRLREGVQGQHAK